MRRALLLALLLTASARAAGPHPSLPAPVVPECFGVNIHFTDPKPGEMEMLAAAGFKWVRMDLTWASTERKPGEYDFSAYDRLVAALDKHKLRAVFILDYGNPLYAEPGDKHPFTSRAGTPEFREAFARWAVAAVSHFKGRGYLWELWNEPNHEGFWKPKANVADYAALAKTTGEALRKAGLVGVPPSGGGEAAASADSLKAGLQRECFIGPATSTIDLAFLEGCFKAGLLEYWDAVSVHPYRQQAPETVEEEYRSLRLLIRKYAPADRTIPIISGEWGYSTQYPAFAGKDSTARDEQQAKWLARQFLTNIANDVALSIWYDWHDDGTNPTEPEHHFGLVRHEYHPGRNPVYDPKPAYTAMKTMTEQLGGFRFNKRLAQTNWIQDGDYILLWEKESEARLAAWTSGKEQHHLILPASNNVQLAVTLSTGMQMEGKVANEPVGHGLRFVPGTTPAYLAFRGANPWLQAAAAITRVPLEVVVDAPGFSPLEVSFRNPRAERVVVQPLPGSGWSARERRPDRHPEKWFLNRDESFSTEVELALSSRRAEGELRNVGLDLATKPRSDDEAEESVTVSQVVKLLPRIPWHVDRHPAPEGRIKLRIVNPSGEAWNGVVKAAEWLGGGKYGGQRTEKSMGEERLNIAEGTTEAFVEIPLTKKLSGRALTGSMSIVFAAKGRPDLEARVRGVSAIQVRADELLAHTDGDAAVKTDILVWPGSPPEPAPIESDLSCRIEYRFEPGWKFVCVNPRPIPQTRQARGQSLFAEKENPDDWPSALGIWLYGDGKGCQARVRFKDSTGQVFQPDGPKIDWKGWRYVTFPMQTTAEKPLAHWGGANDGVIHYPIEWDSIFLLDNVSRQPVEGKIYLSAPTLIY